MISRRGFVTGLFAIVPATSLMHLRGVPLSTLLDPVERAMSFQEMARIEIEKAIREALKPFLLEHNTVQTRDKIAKAVSGILRKLPQRYPAMHIAVSNPTENELTVLADIGSNFNSTIVM